MTLLRFFYNIVFKINCKKILVQKLFLLRVEISLSVHFLEMLIGESCRCNNWN